MKVGETREIIIHPELSSPEETRPLLAHIELIEILSNHAPFSLKKPNTHTLSLKELSETYLSAKKAYFYQIAVNAWDHFKHTNIALHDVILAYNTAKEGLLAPVIK
jgi:hypothetical protein